ncbi:hypothetical protein [Caulobacter radicis]|uniref:Uncharacterized protein n=1 Tax=Caulobacter radicis TaxID=2172650 RepID=A0A2T9JMC3_9CAUL|nr:hypothetical protein [Caulobacter radicis]PVM84814.1 hypothetical protein DDF65_08215 [Caulobacter radicis]PVM87650.1 hypothetical protein DDF62_16130 [Caulobacter radicis]
MKTYPGTRPSPPKGLNDPRSTASQSARPRPIDPDALRGAKP